MAFRHTETRFTDEHAGNGLHDHRERLGGAHIVANVMFVEDARDRLDLHGAEFLGIARNLRSYRLSVVGQCHEFRRYHGGLRIRAEVPKRLQRLSG